MNLVTTNEAAKQLHLSRFTVRKYIREKRIKAIKIGRQFLIPEDEINKILDLYKEENAQYKKECVG